MRIQPSYRSETLICAERENLCLALWSNRPRLNDVRAVVEQAELRGQQYDGKTILLNAILARRPNRPAPRADFSSEVRAELVSFAKRDELHTVATAHLVLEKGLVGAAVRTFLNTIRLVARPVTPLRVFAEAAEACTWISEQPGPEPWDAAGIASFFRDAQELRS